MRLLTGGKKIIPHLPEVLSINPNVGVLIDSLWSVGVGAGINLTKASDIIRSRTFDAFFGSDKKVVDINFL